MMSLKTLLEKSHQALQDRGVDHALIGGFALAVLGIPRATNDVDYLVDESQKENARTALLEAGWKVNFETEDVIHFSDQGSVDLLVARRPLSKKMLKNATVVGSFGIKCLLPEAIIGLKIQAYINDSTREFQDKADIQALIIRYGATLNWDEIVSYADLFGEKPFMLSLRKKLCP
jgi:predicted nucleotidyltransferase